MADRNPSVFAHRFALAQTIGRVLVNLGIAKDPEPTTFTKEEVEKYYGGVSLPRLVQRRGFNAVY